MKKLIKENYAVICPTCKKPAFVAREFDDGTAECIHKNGDKAPVRCTFRIK